MKKITLLIYTIICVNNILHSQDLTSKGNFILSIGSVGYYPINQYNTRAFRNDTLIEKSITKSTNYINMNLNFEASYFIKNNICIGITFPVTPSVNGLYMIGLVNTVGFFTRYYFGQRSHPLNYENNNRFAFFAEGIIIGGYSSANNQSSSLNVLSNTTSQGSNNLKDYILQGKVSAACTYLLFKHIAIDAFGSYYFEYYWSSAESSASTIIDKNISIYNGLGFVLQVDIYL